MHRGLPLPCPCVLNTEYNITHTHPPTHTHTHTHIQGFMTVVAGPPGLPQEHGKVLELAVMQVNGTHKINFISARVTWNDVRIGTAVVILVMWWSCNGHAISCGSSPTRARTTTDS